LSKEEAIAFTKRVIEGRVQGKEGRAKDICERRVGSLMAQGWVASYDGSRWVVQVTDIYYESTTYYFYEATRTVEPAERSGLQSCYW
jgi:hypothetical protein